MTLRQLSTNSKTPRDEHHVITSTLRSLSASTPPVPFPFEDPSTRGAGDMPIRNAINAMEHVPVADTTSLVPRRELRGKRKVRMCCKEEKNFHRRGEREIGKMTKIRIRRTN